MPPYATPSPSRPRAFGTLALLSALLVCAHVTPAGGATFAVDSTGDGGDVLPGDGSCDDGAGRCTLRAAIIEANVLAGADTIAFAIPGAGPHTIAPLSTLPAVTGPIVVDGTTQPGFAGSPVIELDGSGAGAFVTGLSIAGGTSTVRGLVVNRFGGPGITLASSGNAIEGCFVGTDVPGTSPLGNAGPGISVQGPFNRIGTDGDGVADAAERNVVAGNGGNGISIQDDHTVVAGNFVGTDPTGTALVGGGNAGIAVFSSFNRIGTDGDGVADSAERNIVSGNGVGGMTIAGDENVIAGNYVGTDVTGTVGLGNASSGEFGVKVVGSLNRVGTNSDGVSDVLEGNLSSANAGGGVGLFGDENLLAGNRVGTDVTGASALGNAGRGVFVAGNGNLVGTDGDGVLDAAEANLISANHFSASFPAGGVEIQGDGNIVAGNLIGTDAAGTSPLGNTGTAVLVFGNENRIGTDGDGVADEGERNVIAANSSRGVSINGESNVVAGNLLGTDVSGTVPLANGEGVSISAASSFNRVGTNGDGLADAAERNVVVSNGVGVTIAGDQNVVAGNFLGTDITGTVALGNDTGILILGDRNRIGSDGDGVNDGSEANLIAFNSGVGVSIPSNTVRTGNSIRRNAIHTNGNLGIDLRFDGPTPNDPGDPDVGPNLVQNYPVVTLAEAGPTATRVAGTLNSLALTSFTIELFASTAADPTGFGEGERFLGATAVATDALGDASFNLILPAATSPGEVVTATATDPDGNTSEFSAAVVVVAADDVEIDILPFSPRNVIRPGSPVPVPVAILGSDLIDVTLVDVTTLAFGPAGATPVHDLTLPLVYLLHLRDVNHDGKTDLVSHYRPVETGIPRGETEACLTGEIADAFFEACDAIRTRGRSCGTGWELVLLAPLFRRLGRLRRRGLAPRGEAEGLRPPRL